MMETFFIFYSLFWLVVAVLCIAGEWKVFTKAGQPGWACIIPFYNIYVMTQITGKPAIWVLWCCIPGANIVFGIWLINMLSKSFGKEEGFTVGLIFLPFIFWPMLGFGDAKYIGPYGDPVAFHAAQEKNKFSFEDTQS